MKSENKNRIWLASLALVVVGLTAIVGSYELAGYADILKPFGLSLITAAIISFTLDAVSLRSISENLKEVVNYRFADDEAKAYGINAVLNSTPYDQIDRAISDSDRFVLIQTYFPHMGSTVEHLKDLLVRGGEVDVYLLNPKSDLAKQRSKDIGRDISYVSNQIIGNVSELESLHDELASIGSSTKKLRLFHFDKLPSFSLHQAGNTAWMGFYWYGNQSDFGMNLVLDLGSENQIRRLIRRHITKLNNDCDQVALGKRNKAEQGSGANG